MVSSSSGGSPSWALNQRLPFGAAILFPSVTAAQLVAVFFSEFPPPSGASLYPASQAAASASAGSSAPPRPARNYELLGWREEVEPTIARTGENLLPCDPSLAGHGGECSSSQARGARCGREIWFRRTTASLVTLFLCSAFWGMWIAVSLRRSMDGRFFFRETTALKGRVPWVSSPVVQAWRLRGCSVERLSCCQAAFPGGFPVRPLLGSPSWLHDRWE